MASGLSKATHLSHSSGQRCFIDFCLQFGLLITLPASVITISRFISYLSLSYQPSTVKSYLSAVRSLHVIMGLDSPSVNHPRVQLVLRGIKRLQCNNRRLRRPTTPELLLFFRDKLDLSSYGHSLYSLFPHLVRLLIRFQNLTPLRTHAQLLFAGITRLYAQ